VEKSEHQTTDKIIDVSRLNDDLRRSGEHRKLHKIFERVALAQSCLAELQQAAQCIEELRSLANSGANITPSLSIIQHSLLTSALILYVRAAHASAEEGSRGSINVRKLLPAELRPVHVKAVDVRNKAVAHVYYGKSLNDWHQQYAFLKPVAGTAGGWQLATATRYHVFNRELTDQLALLIPEAITVVGNEYDKAWKASAAEFNLAKINLLDYLISPQDFFGCDAETVDSLVGSADKGSAVIYS
jgi:hypothetical protein